MKFETYIEGQVWKLILDILHNAKINDDLRSNILEHPCLNEKKLHIGDAPYMHKSRSTFSSCA